MYMWGTEDNSQDHGEWWVLKSLLTLQNVVVELVSLTPALLRFCS